MRPATQAIVVVADLQEYPRLIAWIEEFAAGHDVPASTSFALQLCLEEAFSNIVRHGYAGDVRVTLDRRERTVLLGFADRGIPFDPTTVPAPARAASIEDAAVGGQGIHLMRTFAQRLDYERRDGENRLRLHFLLPE